jgi:two-component system nitrate/nitrite response regulator NarL
MTPNIRILLVDDHTIFRESLRRLLAGESGLRVVADCATLAEAKEIISGNNVDLVLLDYDLGEEAGIDLLRFLHETQSNVRVLILTAGMVANATLNAIDTGAAGVILKHNGTSQLLEAIRRVAKGEAWWDTSVVRVALSGATARSDVQEKTRDLTERQRLVLHCILDGLSNKEIAAQLECSETSVKASIQELFNKAGVRTRSQLVRIAIERFSADWLRNPR